MINQYRPFWEEKMDDKAKEEKFQELLELLSIEKVDEKSPLLYIFIPDPPSPFLSKELGSMYQKSIFDWGSKGKGFWTINESEVIALAEKAFGLGSDKLYIISTSDCLDSNKLKKWIEKLFLTDMPIPPNTKLLIFDWGDLLLT